MLTEKTETMKPYRIAALCALALIVYSMTSCVTTTTTTTAPDGTVTVIKSTGPSDAAMQAATVAAAVAADVAKAKIIAEK